MNVAAKDNLLAFSDTEIIALRRETKACEKVVHLSNGSASPMPDSVAEAVNQYLDAERSLGPYETAQMQRASLARYYDLASQLIGASEREVAFTSGASSGWNTVLSGLGLSEGDEIITHEDDYGSNHLAYMHLKKTKRIAVKVIEHTDLGIIDIDALEQAITDRTRVILLTHLCMQTGCVQPAKEVGEIATRHNVPFFLDAAQSIGQVPINVADIRCGVLVGSGRKYLRGPRGTGILYVSKAMQQIIEPPLANFASAVWSSDCDFEWVHSAKRYEALERFWAGQIGLNAALDYLAELGVEKVQNRVVELALFAKSKLSDLGAEIIDNPEQYQSGLLLFRFANLTSSDIRTAMHAQKINLTIVQTRQAQLSSPYREEGGDYVRISVHYFNTKAEIEKMVFVLKSLLQKAS